MKQTTCGILLAVAVLAGSRPAHAQLPISVEGRIAAVIPFGDWGELARTGTGLEGDVTFHASPIIGVYGGYSWTRFNTETGLGDGHWTEQGFDAGVKARFAPPAGGPLTPFFRGGVIFHKLSATDSGGTASGDYKVGVDLGAGVEFRAAPRITVVPEASYTQFDPGAANFDVTNVHLGVGVNVRL